MDSFKFSKELKYKLLDYEPSDDPFYQDDQGDLWTKYDEITVDIPEGKVVFSFKHKQVVYLNLPDDFNETNSLTITGLPGRIKTILNKC